MTRDWKKPKPRPSTESADWLYYSAIEASRDILPFRECVPCVASEGKHGTNLRCPFSALFAMTPRNDVGRQSIEVIGTCIYLFFDGDPYVVTAAHCVDGVIESGKKVVFYTERHPSEFLTKCYCTSIPDGGVRDDDRIDICIYPVGSEQFTRLNSLHRFLEEDEVDWDPNLDESSTYVAFGFPVHQNPELISNEVDLHISIPILLSLVAGEHKEEFYSKNKSRGYNRKDHICLDVNKNKLFDLKNDTKRGKATKLPDLRGMSGGPVFSVSVGLNTTKIFTPLTRPSSSSKLVGMVIEYPENLVAGKSLIGIRTAWIREILSKEGRSLIETIPQSRRYTR